MVHFSIGSSVDDSLVLAMRVIADFSCDDLDFDSNLVITQSEKCSCCPFYVPYGSVGSDLPYGSCSSAHFFDLLSNSV